MIGPPLNDHGRLDSVTEVVAELVETRDMVIVELATGYRTTEQLADWIRGLPAGEGTPDRLRLPATAPSAVERAALYQAVAELIDPLPMRQLATLQTSIGVHTFIVENRVAVLLDDRLPRRCLDRRVAAIQDNLPVATAIGWTVQLAAAGALNLRSGPARVARARDAMARLVGDGTAPAFAETIDSIAWLLGLAECVAHDYGPGAVELVRSATRALAELTADALVREHKPFPNLDIEARLARLPKLVGGRLA